MIVAIATALIALVIIQLLWNKYTEKYKHIPTVKYGIPFIGDIFRFPSKTNDWIKYTQNSFKETKSKIYITWFFWKHFIVTMDADIFEHVLKSNDYIEKAVEYNLLNDWLGTGLLISSGKKWKNRRRLLTPAFHFNVLSTHSKLLHKHAEYLLSYLNNNKTEDAVEMSSLVKHFALDSLCETAMGIHCNTLGCNLNDSVEAKYINSVDILTQLLASRFTQPWNKYPFIYKLSKNGQKYFHNLDIAKGFVQSVIEERIENLKDVENIKSSIFLDILIAAYKRNEIDIEGIIEEVNTFMFEGYDTVSSAISWTIYMLGRHQSIQDKLYNEVKNISSENMLDYKTIDEIKYLECVIKETLRLHPSVPKIIRHFKDGAILGKKLTLPPGSTLLLHIFYMHRDESIWKNALRFFPERFLDNESAPKQNAFVYTPFSAGPRNCIGQRYAMMELKIIIFHLIRSFCFESIHEEDDLEMHNDLVHGANNGIWVKYKKR